MINLNRENQHRLFSTYLPFALTIIVALILGLLIAKGDLVFLLIFVAVFFAIALQKTPTLLLWVVLAGGLVFSGLSELYFPQLRYIRWAVVVGAMALMAIAIFRLSTRSSQSIQNNGTHVSPLVWMGIFGLVSLFSGLINQGFSFDTVIGIKGYFQVWGVAYAMAWFGLNRLQADRIMTGLIWLALLQIPFAIHQFLVLVPLRLSEEDANKGIVALDIVVGTFVGHMEAGGANVILAALLVIAIGIIIGFWRAGKISGIKTLILSLIFFVPIALNEAKAVIIFIPLMMVIIFQDTLIKRPFQALFGTFLVIVFMMGLLVVYSFLPRAEGQQNKNLSQFYQDTVAYNFGDKGYGTNRLNRTTVYSFWANHHGIGNLPETLIGHGPGQTNDGAVGLMKSSLTKKTYPDMGIGLTGLSSLLWEVGLIGTLLMCCIFSSAFLSAYRLSNQLPKNTSQYVYLKAVQTGLVVLFANLLHNNYLVYELGFQTLLMVLLGYVFHFERTAFEPNK